MHWYYWLGIVLVVGYGCLVMAIRWIDSETDKSNNATHGYQRTDPSMHPSGRKGYERDV